MMPPTEPVGEKPPDPNEAQEAPPAPSHGGPHGDEGAPAAVTATASTEKIQGAASAAPSYANKLKTNIRFDQRLKRNVLEIHIEKSDKFAQVDLSGDTMVRVLKSIGMNLNTELEGSFVVYGNTPVIIALCREGVNLEKFCLTESIAITKNMSTGIIRPAGKRDVMVTVCGLHWNTPDSLVQEYIQKFGGKLITSGVLYVKYKQGALTGKFNGERQYQVDFTGTTKKMGTFHYLDGMRLKIFYRGNENTCGRCHQGRNKCPGQAVAKACQENKGDKVLLSDHMRKLWAEIGFNPTSFELEDDQDEEETNTEKHDTKQGDREVIAEKIAPAKATITEENIEKITGPKLNNVPREKTEEEIVEFLEKHTKLDKDNLKIQMTDSGRDNSTVRVISGIDISDVLDAVAKIDFKESKEKFWDRPIYAIAIRDLTPTKPEKKEETEKPKNIQKDLLKEKEDGKAETKSNDMKKGKLGTPTRMPNQMSLTSFLTPSRKAQSLFAQVLEQQVLPHDLDNFGTLDDKDDRKEKRKSPPRGNSPDETKHDKRNKTITAIPLPSIVTGTIPKHIGARSKSVSK